MYRTTMVVYMVFLEVPWYHLVPSIWILVPQYISNTVALCTVIPLLYHGSMIVIGIILENIFHPCYRNMMILPYSDFQCILLSILH